MRRLVGTGHVPVGAGRASGRDPGEGLAGCVRKDHRRGTGPVGAAGRMVGERSLAGVGRKERGVGRRIGAGRSAAAVAAGI